MPRAVLRGGLIEPLEPLPSQWKEGEELIVESATIPSPADQEEIERWFEELESAAARIPPEEGVRLEAALHEADKLWLSRENWLTDTSNPSTT